MHRALLLVGFISVVVGPCFAQSPGQAPPPTTTVAVAVAAPSEAAAPAAGATTPAAAAAPSEPSPEFVKLARKEGFKPKKRNGVTMFCYTDATLGTRFETEKCSDQYHTQILIQQREDQRNLMRQQTACTGSNCKGG